VADSVFTNGRSTAATRLSQLFPDKDSIIANPYTPPLQDGHDTPSQTHAGSCLLTTATICIYTILGTIILVCASDIAMTWGDPKGGASGNLPPVLTTNERLSRSVSPGIAAFICFVLCGLLWRFRSR
tara:strand:- start:6712 stop:7092 length:381 start_codon:yes stop_codon:yes gene_type:complete